jgi:hypothetical protein
VNRTLNTFHTAEATSATLRGGRAPALWRRECARVAARLDALERVGRWGAELYTSAPGLSQTPLWGERLAELTAPTPSRDADEDTRRRPTAARPFAGTGTDARTRHPPGKINRPPRPAFDARGFPPSHAHPFQTHAADPPGDNQSPPGAQAAELFNSPRAQADASAGVRGLSRRHPFAQPGESRDARTHFTHDGFNPPASFMTAESDAAFVRDVESLPREAGAEMLRRLAARDASSPDAAQKNARDAAQKSAHTAQRSTGEQHSSHPHARTRATRWPPPAVRAPALPDAPDVLDVLDAPSQHVAPARLPDLDRRAREHEWRSLLAARAAVSLFHAGVSTVAPALLGEPLIAHQWSSPLSGETATRDLLTRLADARTRPTAARRTSTRQHGATQSAPPNASHDPATRMRRDSGTGHVERREDAPDAPVHFRGIEVEPQQQSRGVAPDLVLPGAVSAPVPAESLPSLLPPPLVGMSVLPIALATARDGTRLEAQESAEDLDALAAKIKLILDEQARRHGIDV